LADINRITPPGVSAAVRSSSAASDPNSDDLSCCLDQRSLLGMLKHLYYRDESAQVRRRAEKYANQFSIWHAQ
jgi:hypothetical protein